MLQVFRVQHSKTTVIVLPLRIREQFVAQNIQCYSTIQLLILLTFQQSALVQLSPVKQASLSHRLKLFQLDFHTDQRTVAAFAQHVQHDTLALFSIRVYFPILECKINNLRGALQLEETID